MDKGRMGGQNGSEPIPKSVMEKIADENFKKDLEDKK